MPHVTIQHFPKDFSDAQRRELADALTALITDRFEVPPGAVSIGLEPVHPDEWQARVYGPVIEPRLPALLKRPDYDRQ
ncbi:tautomerase family protein [Streptomyces sp. ODS28]|uniref:tautomerase family protein n=1 Tax=Streptomyces sp. ODS28 TaxID=3136688 RepID=UPI0031E59A18